jgi:hypothetical protein
VGEALYVSWFERTRIIPYEDINGHVQDVGQGGPKKKPILVTAHEFLKMRIKNQFCDEADLYFSDVMTNIEFENLFQSNVVQLTGDQTDRGIAVPTEAHHVHISANDTHFDVPEPLSFIHTQPVHIQNQQFLKKRSLHVHPNIITVKDASPLFHSDAAGAGGGLDQKIVIFKRDMSNVVDAKKGTTLLASEIGLQQNRVHYEELRGFTPDERVNLYFLNLSSLNKNAGKIMTNVNTLFVSKNTQFLNIKLKEKITFFFFRSYTPQNTPKKTIDTQTIHHLYSELFFYLSNLVCKSHKEFSHASFF